MKKKILVFFMIFILIFTFSVNVFAGTTSFRNCTVYNYTDSLLSFAFGPSSLQSSPYLVSSNSSLDVNTGSSTLYFKFSTSKSYFQVVTYDTFLSTFSINVDGNTYSLTPNFVEPYTYIFDISTFSNYTWLSVSSSSNISRISFYDYTPVPDLPFYQPYIDFHVDLLSNTFSFIPDLFSDSYLNLTIFISGLFFILLMIMVIYLVIRRATHIGG